MEGFLAEPPPLRKFHFSVIHVLLFKKIGLLKSSSILEFPLTFLGVGMDIFWNYTIKLKNKLHLPIITCRLTQITLTETYCIPDIIMIKNEIQW